MATWKIANVECKIDLNSKKVGAPDYAASMQSELRIINREYIRLPRVNWYQAREYLIEDEEMEEAYSNTLGDAFELIDDLEEMRRGSSGLSCIDIGVVSTVACLRALGASTITSCNGGWPFSSHHEDYPLIALYALPATLEKIRKAAAQLNLGLSNTEPAAAMLYAASIPQMISFARCLFNEHAPAKFR